MPPRLEFMAGFFGCLYGRAIAIPAYPLRPNQSLSRLEAIVADAQAKLILTTKPLLPYLKGRFAQNSILATTFTNAVEVLLLIYLYLVKLGRHKKA